MYSVRLALQCRAFSSIIYARVDPDRKHKHTLTLRVLKIQDQPIHSSDDQTLSSSGTFPSATRPGRRGNRDYTSDDVTGLHVLCMQYFIILATAHIEENFSYYKCTGKF